MDHASDPINSANPHLTRARLRPPNQNGPSPITINGDSEEEAEADKRPSKLPKASQDADEDAEYKPKSHESTRSAQEAYFIEILNTVKENAKDDQKMIDQRIANQKQLDQAEAAKLANEQKAKAPTTSPAPLPPPPAHMPPAQSLPQVSEEGIPQTQPGVK